MTQFTWDIVVCNHTQLDVTKCNFWCSIQVSKSSEPSTYTLGNHKPSSQHRICCPNSTHNTIQFTFKHTTLVFAKSFFCCCHTFTEESFSVVAQPMHIRNSLNEPTSKAYDQLFALHHNWMIQAIGACMFLLPPKSQFLHQLHEEGEFKSVVLFPKQFTNSSSMPSISFKTWVCLLWVSRWHTP